jgi:hypothetical protein
MFDTVQFSDTLNPLTIDIVESHHIIFENHQFPQNAACSYLRMMSSSGIFLNHLTVPGHQQPVNADCSTINPYQYPGFTENHILSHEREFVAGHEFIEPLQSRLLYIHTTDYHDELYRFQDGTWSLLWQDVIEPTGAESFCGENEECLQRSYDSYVTQTYSATYRADSSREFCINHSWEPFRGTNETLRCFDMAHPEKPILAFETGAWIGSITRSAPGMIAVETYCKDCPEGMYVSCYRYVEREAMFIPVECNQEENMGL